MTQYTRTGPWQDGEGLTSIDAADLIHMEDGIAAALPADELDVRVTDLLSSPATGVGNIVRQLIPATPDLSGFVATSDARLSNQRTPTDASINNAKVQAGAAISLDKTADSTSRLAFTPAERTKLANFQITSPATIQRLRAPDNSIYDLSVAAGGVLVTTAVARESLGAQDALDLADPTGQSWSITVAADGTLQYAQTVVV